MNLLNKEVLRVSKNARSADCVSVENSVPKIAIESLQLISKAVNGLLSKQEVSDKLSSTEGTYIERFGQVLQVHEDPNVLK